MSGQQVKAPSEEPQATPSPLEGCHRGGLSGRGCWTRHRLGETFLLLVRTQALLPLLVLCW